ncbi:hypothetical protein BDV18DRAFT_167171 [Aspergillus unguis]
MVCRGLWNLHINNKWYRLCHPRGRTSPPDDESTLCTIISLRDSPDNLEGWEPVPFPSPIHSNLDYVYTVDRDGGSFIISLWDELDGLLMPLAVRMDLDSIHQVSDLAISDRPYLDITKYTAPNEAQTGPFKTLELDIGIATAINELQAQLFTDFVFAWRPYIDDPLTWRCESLVFKAVSIAILRLAAWDFEVSFDGNADLPISFASIPRWKYPEADVYWFHGFLVVLEEDIAFEDMINKAVLKAQSYLNAQQVYVIVVSPRRVAFVELSRDTVLVSKSLILLSNHSATKCSPGFRALSRIMTSNCWKSHAYKERWQVNLPPEIIQMILHELDPRDTVAFAQASFAARECYYASEPQFKDVNVRGCNSSIPCCGKLSGLDKRGVCCSSCYAWSHQECANLESSSDQYTCPGCQHEACMDLSPGGINRFSRRKVRKGCPVDVGGSAKVLQLRLSKPSHLRPELQFLGNRDGVPPLLVQYTVLFNGAFSGLAYGLEDSPG